MSSTTVRADIAHAHHAMSATSSAGINRSGGSGTPSQDAVSVAPGSSATTRTPCGFISSRRLREKPCNACLAMLYEPPFG